MIQIANIYYTLFLYFISTLTVYGFIQFSDKFKLVISNNHRLLYKFSVPIGISNSLIFLVSNGNFNLKVRNLRDKNEQELSILLPYLEKLTLGDCLGVFASGAA